MKKKALTSLLISTTLIGAITPSVFALDDLSVTNFAINRTNERLVRDSKPIRFNTVECSQTFTIYGQTYRQNIKKTGFQSFYNTQVAPNAHGERWKLCHGYVNSVSENTFTVVTDFFDLNGKMYHSNKNGNSSTGLTNIDGDLYFFNYDLNDPYAKKWWQTIDGNTYYFGDDFKAKKGFSLINGSTFYFDKYGHLQRGLQRINGRIYYLGGHDGRLITGWYSMGNNRYFFDVNQGGAAQTGWYYGDKAGVMHFDDNGVMSKGVTKVGDDYYVFTTNGRGLNAYKKYGWYTDKSTGKRYYFDIDNGGKAVRGRSKLIGGVVYTFNDDGSLKK